MTIWDDLMKGNDENKIIDWINHMGRDVQACACCDVLAIGHGCVKFVLAHFNPFLYFFFVLYNPTSPTGPCELFFAPYEGLRTSDNF